MKRKHILGNQAHEGPQPPSNLEERKGLKEAQHAAHVRSTACPHPPRTRGVISASLEGSPPKPSTAPRTSASLEGSEPALEKADHLRPKELSSRTPGVRLHLTGPTVLHPHPARGRVWYHHVSQRREGSTQPNSRGARTSHGVLDPHILSGPLSREGTDTPPEEVWSRHVSAGAGTRAAAKLPLEDLLTYHIQCRLTDCTVGRALPRCTIQPLAPLTPRASVCYAS